MISIASNFASQTTINQINSSNNALTSSMERLSTGNRINSAADDAAGLQIASRLSTQSRGMSVAMRNSQDATSLLQTAEGALEELGNIGSRMNDLATQAANGTNSQKDLDALNGEYQALGAEMNNILENTNFGGQKLLNGSGISAKDSASASAVTSAKSTYTTGITTFKAAETIYNGLVDAQTAAQDALDADPGNAGLVTALTDAQDAVTAGQTDFDDAKTAFDLTKTAFDAAVKTSADTDGKGMTFQTGATSAETLNVSMNLSTIQAFSDFSGDLSSAENATKALDAISGNGGLLGEITSQRSNLGASMNRIDHNIANMTQMKENLDASTGRIMDTDFASESGEMTKQQMLVQTGAKMLSTTKMVPQLAMSMLG